jgi:hypothetical protein
VEEAAGEVDDQTEPKQSSCTSGELRIPKWKQLGRKTESTQEISMYKNLVYVVIIFLIGLVAR